MLFWFTIDQRKDFILTLIWIALAWGTWNLHIWFTWKLIIRKIYLIINCLKIHGKTCELNFWIWDYHLIMGPIQNMEAMFQNLKMHSSKKKTYTLEQLAPFIVNAPLTQVIRVNVNDDTLIATSTIYPWTTTCLNKIS